MLAELGFREWAYQVIRAEALPDEKPVILTTFSDAWRDHYIDSSYHLIDPVILKGPERLLPFTWSSMSFGIEPTDEQKSFFAEAEEFGLGEGLGIPVHGAYGSLAMISMVAEEETRRLARMLHHHGEDVHLISLIFHNLARELMALGRCGRSPISLSPRERECLIWLANGKTRWEISLILGISEETVKYHFKNIRAKFGTYSRHEIIIQAVRLGLIDP
ncbi:LuxR family transcriptional regulator [Polymorphum gilvum SL003B-26A1]|uniref:LuxR family transcriptional regulator n=1 Tax=Polymorphum gilvum (strain LMG 25793 / CGMCC 1.9160 / SL003B-26A1) TaxID=991905 RepID=F2J3W5_POLGS|nr:LuxR family transcriptional regulator [Polymorphum gilvum SL003B-26A1]